MSNGADVLIIGAGLSGLACGRHLADHHTSFQIIEASDGIGGRVRTDEFEGFLLDRGFQVLLTAYPEAQRTLDYHALDLKKFTPGALSFFAGRMNKVADPWRTRGGWSEALRSDFAGFLDKLRVVRLRSHLRASSIDQIFKRPERSTRDALVEAGFSEEFIHHFFRPFFGSILLDGDLKSSSRVFEFVCKMFAEGDAAIPARGMGAIPAQIASHLPAGSVRLHAHAESLHENELTLTSGESLRARAIVVAADGPSAAHLVGEAEPASRSVSCFYYSTDEPPVPHSMLVLNGDGAGPVNNFTVMSQVAPSYAPSGKALVSITVLGTHQLTDQQLGGFIIAQMKNWFGPVASSWRYLKSYRIPHAQPQQFPGALEPAQRPVRVRPGIYLCGDHRDHASIHGAMVSGRRAAEAVLADLSR